MSTLTARPAEERDRAAIDAIHEATWGGRRGLRIAAVDPDAVDQSRATIKPEIPLEIHDELRLEMAL